MEYSTLATFIFLLTNVVIVATVFRRLHIPPILGYLVVGIIVGPHALNLLPSSEIINHIAEFGVVFLMFTIGLEFSLVKMLAMKHIVFGFGGLQVIITSAIAFSVALLLGIKLSASLIIGGIVAMSSTAIVSKQLTDQLELNTEHGQNAIGVLLFQDLAVIPFLILIPSLSTDNSNILAPLGWAFLKGIGAIIIIVLAGRWILRPLFRQIAMARSIEIFTLATLLVTISAAWLTQLLGLSLALGAFMAGMMLGETEFRHQIEAEIRPFRDILLGLFFISVGMLLNLEQLTAIWGPALVVLSVLIIMKGFVVTLLARLFGNNPAIAIRTGIILAHGGEFGFALLTQAIALNVFAERTSQIILTALVFSMVCATFFIRYNKTLSSKLSPQASKTHEKERTESISASCHTLKDHVIICGFGRVGQNIARFLELEGFVSTALDMDIERVQSAQLAGENVNYGNSSNLEILKAAGIDRAKAIIISFNDYHASEKILQQVRQHYKQMPILVRTRDDTHLKDLQALGASEIVPETLEASLMLAYHVLILMEVPVSRALMQIRKIQKKRYALCRQTFASNELADRDSNEQQREQLFVVKLTEQAYAIGHRLHEFNVDEHNVTVTAVRRGSIRGPEPEPDTELKVNDVLVLYGLPTHLSHIESLLLTGK
ncbi:MAG: cation:proton antiporter [Gammaproteobacteria bacterium]